MEQREVQQNDKQNKKRMHHTYRMLKKIGQGNFGNVFLAQSELDRKYYVIKVIRNEKTLEQKENILREVKVMKSLRHQYVITYRQSFLDKNKNICIVMEYAESGDLETRIASQRKTGVPFEQDQILEWFIQICFGLKYIHDNKIVHRDLKCQNIFLTAKNECKIGDFGISKIMEETFDLAKTKIGTPFCMAPEIWESLPYNQKSDIWSLGCILYQLCSLKNPFIASNAGSYLVKITQGKYEPIKGSYSDQLKELVSELLNKQPQHRPSVHKILEKEFIKKRISATLSKTLCRYEETINDKFASSGNSLLKSSPGNSIGVCSSSANIAANSSLPPPHNRSLSSTKQPDERVRFEKMQLQLNEYKQNYPLVLQENKILKQQLEELEAEKEQADSRIQETIKELLESAERPDLTLKDLRRLVADKLTNLL